MRRLILISSFILTIFVLSGCGQIGLNRTEIDRIFNTRIIAIDKIAENKILYTITTKSSSINTQGQPSSTKISELLVSEGSTVLEAARAMMAYAHKKPHYGHTEFILFGEDTARDGILPYLDFISRNQEFRYNAKIYIIKGETANAFINKLNSGEIFLADKLSLIEDNANALSLASKVTLSEALYILDQKHVATFIPYLISLPAKAGEQNSQGNYNMLLMGYGVFNKDKLQGFLNKDLSRGVNWIKNRIKAGIFTVEAPDKKKVSLEIIQNQTAIKPHIDENGLQCTIDIKFNSNISEIQSETDLFTKEGFEYLQQQQEKQVKKEVEEILKYAQDNNLDIFGLKSNFRIKYPMMKNEIDANWSELFPEIRFHVEIESKVTRTYLIRQPAGSN